MEIDATSVQLADESSGSNQCYKDVCYPTTTAFFPLLLTLPVGHVLFGEHSLSALCQLKTAR